MELLTNMANSVKEKEINTCSRYSVLKQIGDTSEPQICVSETYESKTTMIKNFPLTHRDSSAMPPRRMPTST